MTAREKRWTAAQVRALGVRTDIRTAGEIFGLSATQAYEAAKAERLPFPVLRVGVRYIVPVAPILQLLGIDGGSDDRLAAGDQRRSGGGEPPGPGTNEARPALPGQAAAAS